MYETSSPTVVKAALLQLSSSEAAKGFVAHAARRRQPAKSKLAAVALAVGVFNDEIILTHLLRSSSRPHKSC